jgi:hypothetical protein
MSPASACEICGRPGSRGGFRYMRHGTCVGEIASNEMKHCWTCKKLGCDRCLVVTEETADDHFIDIYSCRDCLSKRNEQSPDDL